MRQGRGPSRSQLDSLSVDIVVLVRDASVSTGNGDRFVLEMVKRSSRPAILALNKIDKIADKKSILPLIEFYSGEHNFSEIVPVSALKEKDLDVLTNSIIRHLPEGEPIFDEDDLTDQPMRTLAAEMVREKILQTTGEEIPFVTGVVTEHWDESDPSVVQIYCVIYVEKDSQKPIIIGKRGQKIKEIGTAARADIEKLLGRHVNLKLFVKVVENWRNKGGKLNEMGIIE